MEETIIKADGSKVTNRKETITRGDQGGATSSRPMMLERGRDKENDDKKSKGGGMLGVGITETGILYTVDFRWHCPNVLK